MKLIKLYQPMCRDCVFVENFLQDTGIEYESVNVQESPEVAAKFKIMSTPVTVLVDDEDKEVKRSAGFHVDELEEMISQL